MQRQYQYSKWDSIHEPYNIVENVLKDDESVYKAVTPSLDFTLYNNQTCFVSEVVLFPGDCGPQHVEVKTNFNFNLDFGVKPGRQVDNSETIYLHKKWSLEAGDTWRTYMQVLKS